MSDGRRDTEVKVHAQVSSELDVDPKLAAETLLKNCTDDQLLAEIGRRGIDIHHNVTEQLVKKSYRFEKSLGHGASGEVHLVSKISTGEKFACKVIHKDDNMNDAESMGTEIEIMKRVRHKHVVTLYELYESSSCMWLILELVDGGDINYFISSHKHYTESVCAHHFKQILQGLHYLHQQGVVHRDIKLDNILIKGDHEYGDVKIADFGLSALVQMNQRGYDRDQSSKRKEFTGLKEMWGTATYFAPEVIDCAYGPQADMWSAGVILYEMLSGQHPFDADSEDELFDKIQNAKFPIEGGVWDKVSPEAKDLVKKILTVNPVQRFSATDSLTHPWITAVGTGSHPDSVKPGVQERLGANKKASPDRKQAPGEGGLFGFFKQK
jgi:calcium-dependent protein kinase